MRAAGPAELLEALNAAEESVAIYERLVEQLPQVFTNDLRSVLATLTEVLDRLDRSEEATKIQHRIDQLGKPQ